MSRGSGVTKRMILWPGLPVVRLRGSWRGLLVAIGFGWLLSVAIWTRWGWSEWFPDSIQPWLWWSVAGAWVVGTLGNWRVVRKIGIEQAELAAGDDAYREAVAAYLSGQWVRVESLLTERLTRHPQDAESRLLLGTLLRRRHREMEAKNELMRLLRSDGGALWVREAQFELNALQSERPSDATSPTAW